jgi:hypothetical protein
VCMCQGPNRLLGCIVVYIGMFLRNDGALRAVKMLYIHLCTARDSTSGIVGGMDR